MSQVDIAVVTVVFLSKRHHEPVNKHNICRKYTHRHPGTVFDDGSKQPKCSAVPPGQLGSCLPPRVEATWEVFLPRHCGAGASAWLACFSLAQSTVLHLVVVDVDVLTANMPPRQAAAGDAAPEEQSPFRRFFGIAQVRTSYRS